MLNVFSYRTFSCDRATSVGRILWPSSSFFALFFLLALSYATQALLADGSDFASLARQGVANEPRAFESVRGAPLLSTQLPSARALSPAVDAETFLFRQQISPRHNATVPTASLAQERNRRQRGPQAAERDSKSSRVVLPYNKQYSLFHSEKDERLLSRGGPSRGTGQGRHLKNVRLLVELSAEDQENATKLAEPADPLDHHETHHHADLENTGWHKAGATLVIIAVTLLGCLMPYYLDRKRSCNYVMTYVNSFAAGAFLGLALFHLLPEALHSMQDAHIGFRVGESWYSGLYILTFAGFFFIFLIEKVTAPAFALRSPELQVLSHNHHHHHHHRCPSLSDRAPNYCHDSSKSTEGDLEAVYATRHPTVPGLASATALPCKQAGPSSTPLFALECATSEASTECAKPAAIGCSAHGLREPMEPDSTVSRHPSHPISFISLLMCLSLCVHSIFEGIVVGLFADPPSVWISTMSIAGHKWAAAFALAANCIQTKVTIKAAVVYLTVFSLSTPVGIAIGLGASKGGAAFFAIMNCLSLGTILYAACEMLFGEFEHFSVISRELLKVCAVILGAGLVLSFMMLHLAEGSHAHT